jgi:hypothetical protein
MLALARPLARENALIALGLNLLLLLDDRLRPFSSHHVGLLPVVPLLAPTAAKSVPCQSWWLALSQATGCAQSLNTIAPGFGIVLRCW